MEERFFTMQYLISTKRNDGDIITRSTAKIQADYYFNRSTILREQNPFELLGEYKKEVIIMDKYEEFKKWFKEQTDISWRATGCHFVDYDDDLPFSKFEHEQKEKQKEKKIKEIIADAIITTPLRETISPKNTMYCGDEVIDKIYYSLNRGGYLK